MKKNMSWKFTDESSITLQSSVSGPGEFGCREAIEKVTKDIFHLSRVKWFQTYPVAITSFATISWYRKISEALLFQITMQKMRAL